MFSPFELLLASSNFQPKPGVAAPQKSSYKGDMKTYVEHLATTTRDSTDVCLVCNVLVFITQEIWTKAKQHFDTLAQGQAYEAITFDQTKNLISNARKQLTGGDVMRAIETDEFSLLHPNVPGAYFLQFNVLKPLKWKKNEQPRLTRILGFAHPQLLLLLKDKNLDCYIDGTFDCTPKPFYQTVMLMVMDRRTGSYVPVFYLLLQGKAEAVYRAAWKLISDAVDGGFEPSTVHCDFELGMNSNLFRLFIF